MSATATTARTRNEKEMQPLSLSQTLAPLKNLIPSLRQSIPAPRYRERRKNFLAAAFLLTGNGFFETPLLFSDFGAK